MAFRSNYWGSSKVIDWLRERAGHEKPTSATSRGWKEWKAKYKAAHPKLYWFTEDFVDDVQDVINWPRDKINDLLNALNARFKDRYFGMTSTLSRWRYHEIDTRMLYCNFQTLVDYVEIELASNELWGYEDGKSTDHSKEFNHRQWHNSKVLRLFVPEWRSSAAGLKHLEWERNLRKDEGYYGNWEPHITEAKATGEFGTLTRQAEKAEEVLTLYTWWTEIRPNRADPYDISGCNRYWEEKKMDAEDILSDDLLNDPDKRRMYDVINTLEEQYNNEDTDMLVRLVKIRKSLWT